MWRKDDDESWNSDKLIALSHEAFRLRAVALSFAAHEWPDGAGDVSRDRLRSLARMHSIADPDGAIDELTNKDRQVLEPRPRGMFHLHHVEQYMPRPDLSAVRAAAGRRGGFARHSNGPGLAIAIPSATAIAKQTGLQSPESLKPPYPLTSNGQKNGHEPPVSKEQLVRFTTVWNANRGDLPLLRKPPTGRDSERLVGKAWACFDGDEAMLGAAIRAASQDEFYLQKHYGFETFCRRMEGRWAGAASRAKPEPQVLTGDALL